MLSKVPPAPVSAFQACARAAPAQGGPAPVSPSARLEALSSQPGATSSENACISAAECVVRLTSRTCAILRGAMIAQQDTFTDQLWELHRVTRVQGQKAMLLSAYPASAGGNLQDSWLGVGSSLFSRHHQTDLLTLTMDSIASLPTVPATLRRHPTRKRKLPDNVEQVLANPKTQSSVYIQHNHLAQPSSTKLTQLPANGSCVAPENNSIQISQGVACSFCQ
jgi:hypothetical protein